MNGKLSREISIPTNVENLLGKEVILKFLKKPNQKNF